MALIAAHLAESEARAAWMAAVATRRDEIRAALAKGITPQEIAGELGIAVTRVGQLSRMKGAR